MRLFLSAVSFHAIFTHRSLGTYEMSLNLNQNFFSFHGSRRELIFINVDELFTALYVHVWHEGLGELFSGGTLKGLSLTLPKLLRINYLTCQLLFFCLDRGKMCSETWPDVWRGIKTTPSSKNSSFTVSTAKLLPGPRQNRPDDFAENVC